MARPKKIITIEGKNITPKRVSGLKKLATKINQRLAKLENAGLQLDSNEYRNIMYYAIDKSDKMYNVDTTKGSIRVTTDLSRFNTLKELQHYQDTLKSIEESKTSTIRGTKAAIRKGQETLKEKLKIRPGSMKFKDIDYDKYREFWRIYRNNVTDKNKQKMNSDTIFNIMVNEKGFYDLSEEDLETIAKYANSYRGENLEDIIYEDYEELF